jgi:hypothetical protein
MKISEDEFVEKYKPIVNHICDEHGFDFGEGCCLYETYAPEIGYVHELSKTTKRVWTVAEGDNETIAYMAGFHYVNRLGFLVTEVPWENEDDYVETESMDEFREWIITDPNCDQMYCELIPGDMYKFRENREINPVTHETALYETTLSYEDYDEAEIIDACDTFGYTADEVKEWIAKGENIPLILECIFELSNDEYL